MCAVWQAPLLDIAFSVVQLLLAAKVASVWQLRICWDVHCRQAWVYAGCA